MDGPDASAAIEQPHVSSAAGADDAARAAHDALAAGRPDDAEAILAAAERRHPDAAAILVARARLAERRGGDASAAWARVREALWDQPLGFIGGARAARDAGRMAEAAALLATARKRFPEEDEPLIESGWLAQVARDWPAAAQWWEQTRQRAPQHVVGFLNGALAAREMGALDEAEALIEDAKRRFADQPDPWIESAMLAQQRRDWPAAAARWATLREHFPDAPTSFSGAARALREQRKFAEADALLSEAVARFPDDAGLRAERCWLAHVAQDWPEAASRWAELRRLAPALSVGFTSGAVALRELGRQAEAEDVLAEAIDRYIEQPESLADVLRHVDWGQFKLPTEKLIQLEEVVDGLTARSHPSVAPYLAGALIARERLNWSKYRHLLEEACRENPDDRRARILLSEAAELIAGPEADASSALAVANNSADSRIVIAFESLGGGFGNRKGDALGGGCEFGFFQRHMGVEPLSLLRWATIEPPDLVRGLQNQFVGLGETESLRLLSQGHYDWQAFDESYNVRIDHTHLDRAKVDIDQARTLVSRRFKYLSRKLLDDLHEGEKIFVYRLAGGDVSPNVAVELAEAIRAYGRGMLLFVTQDANLEGAFTAGPLTGNLMRAKVHPPERDGIAIRFESWLMLCRHADSVWKSANG